MFRSNHYIVGNWVVEIVYNDCKVRNYSKFMTHSLAQVFNDSWWDYFKSKNMDFIINDCLLHSKNFNFPLKCFINREENFKYKFFVIIYSRNLHFLFSTGPLFILVLSVVSLLLIYFLCTGKNKPTSYISFVVNKRKCCQFFELRE